MFKSRLGPFYVEFACSLLLFSGLLAKNMHVRLIGDSKLTPKNACDGCLSHSGPVMDCPGCTTPLAQ